MKLKYRKVYEVIITNNVKHVSDETLEKVFKLIEPEVQDYCDTILAESDKSLIEEELK